MKASVTPLLASMLLCASSPSLGASIVGHVEGYAIIDSEKPSDPQPCQMTRSYREPDDRGGKGLFFAHLEGIGIVVSLVNTRWSWDTNAPPKVSFRIDDQSYAPRYSWHVTNNSVGATFAETLAPKLGEGKRIVIGMPNGPEDFDLTGFGPAFEALQRCNRAARPERNRAGSDSPAGTSGQAPVVTSRSQDPMPRRDGTSAPRPAGAAPPEPKTAGSVLDRERGEDEPVTFDELRAMAFLAGLIIQSGIERCEVATTARQRAIVSEKVEALRARMQDLDEAFRERASREPCPDAEDAEVEKALRGYVEAPPETFALDMIDKKGRGTLVAFRTILAAVRPAATTETPRAATYLYGLVLRDVIGECDIRTTAKQRTAFEAKMASLQPEMAESEAALLERKGPFKACPPTERIAEMEEALPRFIDATPEDFAAEMDTRSKADAAD